MAKEKPLKSSYELAMERLRKKDREQGIEQPAPLTDEQKRMIAELRAKAQAELAQIDIMHQKQLTAAADPAELAKLDEQLQIDRHRVESRLESEIARVRSKSRSD